MCNVSDVLGTHVPTAAAGDRERAQQAGGHRASVGLPAAGVGEHAPSGGAAVGARRGDAAAAQL